jgi:hypothetical protein
MTAEARRNKEDRDRQKREEERRAQLLEAGRALSAASIPAGTEHGEVVPRVKRCRGCDGAGMVTTGGICRLCFGLGLEAIRERNTSMSDQTMQSLKTQTPMPGVAEAMRHLGSTGAQDSSLVGMPPRPAGQEVGRLEAKILELHDVVEGLTDRMSLLVSRLTGVLSAETPEPEKPKTCEPGPLLCPMAEAVRVLTHRVQVVREQICDTLERLQL